MPILSPEVQKALRAAGLTSDKKSDSSLVEKLGEHSLSLDEVIEELSFLVRNTSNESLKKSALETVLKLHGALKEQAAPLPSITINISDPFSASGAVGINPILIPRKTALREVPPLEEKESVN